MPKREPVRSSSSREALILKYSVSTSEFRRSDDGSPNKWTERLSYQAEVITEPEKHRAFSDIPGCIWTVNISRTKTFHQRKRSASGSRLQATDEAVFSIFPEEPAVQSVGSVVTVEVTTTSEECPSFRLENVGSLDTSGWDWTARRRKVNLDDLEGDPHYPKQLPVITFQLVFTFFCDSEKQATHDVRFMLNSPADCILVASDGRKFHAHRAVLAARSPVFSAMFRHNTKEKNKGLVQITDLSGKAVEAFLVFLYDHTLDADEVRDYLEEVYHAADKYDLGDLRDFCEKILCSTIDRKNAIKRLAFADDCGLVKLKKRALEFVTDNKSSI